MYAIAREFVEQYNEYKEKIVIHLTTAVEASDKLKEEFVAKAIALSGKRNISLENKIDPSIIGGFILRINDLQYNASISYKLQAIQEQFKENVFEHSLLIYKEIILLSNLLIFFLYFSQNLYFCTLLKNSIL